jgi:hypothetical protein
LRSYVDAWTHHSTCAESALCESRDRCRCAAQQLAQNVEGKETLRLFDGVDGLKGEQGDLFGVANLFKCEPAGFFNSVRWPPARARRGSRVRLLLHSGA